MREDTGEANVTMFLNGDRQHDDLPDAVPNGSPMVNALTIDVEDYFHVTAFEGCVDRREWNDYPSRVVPNTERILALLADHQVRATFFILGWVAERFPGLVRTIQHAGHEIGCHSYWHRLVYRLTPEEFREDLRRARAVTEAVAGCPVVSHRAPTWSITQRSLWALEILHEEGFHYDSSIFPVYHDRYGIPHAPTDPHAIPTGAGSLWEFPPSVARLGPLNLAISGGGYFRLYPVSWTAWCIARLNKRLGRPFLFYLHPWELDPDQPRLPAPAWVRWRHYVNLATTEQKLKYLLRNFRFAPFTEALHCFIDRSHKLTGPDPDHALRPDRRKPANGTAY